MTKTLNQLTEITTPADDDLFLLRDTSAIEDFKLTALNARGYNLAPLANNTAAQGSDLVAHTGTSDTVTEALDGIQADYYRTTNILGTVSQSTGVPTGAIIERGSNANGEYVKFADGTLECWHTLAVPYKSAFEISTTWNFPTAFIDTNVSGAVCIGLSSPAGMTDTARPKAQALFMSDTPSSAEVGWVSDGSFVSSEEGTAKLIAKGRWF